MAKRTKSEREAGLNGRVMNALGGLDPRRVENAVGPGMPDVAFIGGWIENKRIRNFPARDNTIVRVDHYRPDQRAWHVAHRSAGGRCYVCLEVGTDWRKSTTYVFDAKQAAIHLGVDWCKAQMDKAALLAMNGWHGDQFRMFIDTHEFA